MATTYEWQIDWMKSSTQDVNGFPEVVLTAGWRCNGTDGTYSASNYGSVSFTPPQEGEPNFTPYADLTQDQVLGWVWESGVDKTAAEESVTSQVNALANPVEEQRPLPWATLP